MYRFIVMLSLLFVCSFSMASTEDLKFDNQMELLIDLNCSDTIAINSNINLQSIVPLISDEHIVIGEYLIDNFELSNIERYIGKELTSHKMPMKAMCRSSD